MHQACSGAAGLVVTSDSKAAICAAQPGAGSAAMGAAASPSSSARGSGTRSINPRQARRPARVMATATCSTRASCGVRAALLLANTRASVWMPASVTRRVSWPSADTRRSSRPAASSSTSIMSAQGQPAER